jgi:hypothetical protein
MLRQHEDPWGNSLRAPGRRAKIGLRVARRNAGYNGLLNLAKTILIFGIGYSETVTSPSTGVASGVVKGIRLLVVTVLQRTLRAVMMCWYIIRYTGSGFSRSVQNRPANRRHGSILARALNAVCPDGGKCHDSLPEGPKALEEDWERSAKRRQNKKGFHEVSR